MKAPFLVLLVALLPAVALASCTTKLFDTAGLITCTGAVTKDVNEPAQSWDTALKALAPATTLQVSFEDVSPFSATSFTRALDIIFGLGSSANATSVQVLVSNCTMRGVEADYAALVALAGVPKAYSLRVQNSEFVGNALNVTGALAAQSDLTASLQVVGSAINRNTLIAVGLAVVGGPGSAAVSLAEGSQVERNDVYLRGALAVASAASASATLAGSNVTGNNVSAAGVVAIGGQAGGSVTGLSNPTVVDERNEVDARVLLVQEQPLVTAVVDLLMGVGFNESSFDLPAALTKVQNELCAVLAPLSNSSTPAAPELGPLAGQVDSLLCGAGKVDLASIAPNLTQWLGEGLGGLAGALDGLLSDSGAIESLVSAIQSGAPLGSTVDDLLAKLLASPGVQNGAAVLGDLLSQLGSWLDKPISGSSTGGADLGSAIKDIIQGIGAAVNGGGQDGGDGQSGSDDQGGLGGATGLTGGLADLLQGVLGGLGLGGGGDAGGDDAGGDGGTSPADIITSIVSAIGGQGSPLAGKDVTSLIPILGAVLQDPNAVAALPGLLGGALGGGGSGGDGSGGLDLAALGPILQAISANKDASAALPDALGLLGGLGLNLGGAAGGSS